MTIFAVLSTFLCSAQADYCNNASEQVKVPKFAFTVFFSTYYFYSFTSVHIPNASGGISVFKM